MSNILIDKRGMPVYLFEVAPLNSKTMAAYAKSSAHTSIAHTTTKGTTPPKLLRLFALYENLICFIQPLTSALRDRPYPNTPISQSNNIVDISGVGLKQFWNLRSHMQDASTLATAHYPETLDRIFVCVQCGLEVFRLTPLGYWRPLLFPHSLGLDKTVV